jgi:signal transduction histidine kinase
VRKEAEAARERALAEAEEGRRTLEALMEYVPLGIAIAEAPDVRIKMVSRQLLDITHKDAETVIGATGDEMPERFSIYQTDGLRMARPEELAIVRATRSGETVTDEERLIIRPDGTSTPLLCNADLTRLKKAERDRTNFYAMVSHDIRSPLSAIIGNAEFILTYRKTKLDEDTIKMVASMLKSCEKIRSLVDDFLVHSRLEAGGAVLSFKRVDAAQILKDVHEELSVQAKKKGVELIAEADEGLPKAYIDRKHVVRALGNLVQNALDYTPKGGRVSIKAEQAKLDDGDALVYTVSDTGPGIAASEQALIFEKYYRSPSARGVKGTGLGLAIARSVAEAHAGRVELASEPGKGSTFRLVLPVIEEKE